MRQILCALAFLSFSVMLSASAEEDFMQHKVKITSTTVTELMASVADQVESSEEYPEFMESLKAHLQSLEGHELTVLRFTGAMQDGVCSILHLKNFFELEMQDFFYLRAFSAVVSQFTMIVIESAAQAKVEG